MKQATKNVCLALSDDEDYVSFDEEDLNAGIQDLYDNDSAEDAASDISNEEYFESNNNNNRNNMPGPQPIEPILHFPLPPTNITQPATATINNQSQHYPQYPVYAPPIPTNTNTNRSYNNNMRHQRSSSIISSRNHRGSARGRGRGRGTGRGRGRGRGRARGGYLSNRNRNRSMDDLSQLSAFTEQRRKINNNDLFGALHQINDPIPPQPLPQLPPLQNRNRHSLPQPMAPTLFADNRNFNLPQPMVPPPPPPPMARNNNNKQNKLSKRIQKLNEMKAKKKRRKDRKIIHKQKINTNVISIELGTLSQSASNIATGDPIKCANGKCLSVLSKYDKLLKKYDDIKLDDDDESIWICSFCNNVNIIQIDAEEMPLNETIDYILEPAQENKQNDNQNESDPPHIIFCIDISGSMCVTQPVQGKKVNLKGDRLKKESDELSNFIDPMDRNQWMPNQSQNVTYISRLQSVQAAVDAQIEKLKTEQPALKVGLVTFNNEVTVYGDAMKDDNNNGFEIITGDKLNNLAKLQEIGSCGNCKISHCVSDSHGALSDALWSLEEKGQTSLGPALTVSTSMASIKRGSQVILCTDGLANIGVGKIDDSTDADTGAFYENLGNWAMEKGVVVSIISITDDGCNLQALGRIVEISGGNLRRINPLKLTEKFSGILDKEIIATLTNAKMLLHPGLKFVDTVSELQNVNPFDHKPADIDKKQNAVVMDRDTDKKDTETEMSKARKLYAIPSSQQDVGNVFEDTTIFFEYGISRDVLKKDFNGLRHLPFQVHILYNKIDGRKMLRVITQLKQVTYDRRDVKDHLDYSVLSKYGTRVTTKLCDIGDYEASRAFTNANARYMHSNAQNSLQINNLANYVNNNIGLDYQMQQQQQQEVVNYNRNNSYHHNYSPSMNNLNNNWIARSEQITPNVDSNNNNINNNNMRGQMSMNNMNNMNNAHYQQATPQQNIQQQQARRTNRSDKFSSLNYGMKRKF